MSPELPQYSQRIHTLHKWRLSFIKQYFIHPCVNICRQRIFAMNVRLRIGRISIVIQIAAPFMPSVYEQTKNTKSLLVC